MSAISEEGFSRVSLPDPYHIFLTSGNRASIRRRHCIEKKVIIGRGMGQEGCTRSCIVDSHIPLTGTKEMGTIVEPRNIVHNTFFTKKEHLFARGSVPDLNGSIFAPRSQIKPGW